MRIRRGNQIPLSTKKRRHCIALGLGLLDHGSSIWVGGSSRRKFTCKMQRLAHRPHPPFPRQIATASEQPVHGVEQTASSKPCRVGAVVGCPSIQRRAGRRQIERAKWNTGSRLLRTLSRSGRAARSTPPRRSRRTSSTSPPPGLCPSSARARSWRRRLRGRRCVILWDRRAAYSSPQMPP